MGDSDFDFEIDFDFDLDFEFKIEFDLVFGSHIDVFFKQDLDDDSWDDIDQYDLDLVESTFESGLLSGLLFCFTFVLSCLEFLVILSEYYFEVFRLQDLHLGACCQSCAQ